MSTTWLEESPVTMVEGEVIQYSVDFVGVSSLSSPVSTVYKNGSDYSASVQLSGDSDSVSGNTFTLKKITAVEGDAGQSYIVNVAVTTDSTHDEIRKLEIRIVKNEQ